MTAFYLLQPAGHEVDIHVALGGKSLLSFGLSIQQYTLQSEPLNTYRLD